MKSKQPEMNVLKRTIPTLTALFLVLFFYGKTQAQEAKKVRLGLTASPSFAWISPDNKGYEGDGIRLGFKYGIIADFSLFQSNNYFLHTGFTINHVGGKLLTPSAEVSNNSLVAVQNKNIYKLRYIDIPLVIKLKTNEIGYMTYYGMFGSEIGFNVRAKKDYENIVTNKITDHDIKDNVNFMKASLIIGAGVEYNISGNTMLVAGLTFSNGLTNILKGDANLVDSNGVTQLDSSGIVKDRKLVTRSNFLAINIAVMF